MPPLTVGFYLRNFRKAQSLNIPSQTIITHTLLQTLGSSRWAWAGLSCLSTFMYCLGTAGWPPHFFLIWPNAAYPLRFSSAGCLSRKSLCSHYTFTIELVMFHLPPSPANCSPLETENLSLISLYLQFLTRVFPKIFKQCQYRFSILHLIREFIFRNT